MILTQRALGERLQKPQSWIYNCETANRRVDVTEFIVWARACRIDPQVALVRRAECRRSRGIYLTELFVAWDEVQAVRNVTNFARNLKWCWNDYDDPVGVYVHPGRLTPTRFGRVAVAGKSYVEGVVTYRVGRTWEK